MNRCRSLVLPLIVLFLTMVLSSAAVAETLALTNVNVIPMDREAVLTNQTIIIDNGVFVTIGDAGSVTIPAGARRIDGQGGYAIPGLAEMHSLLPSDRDDAEEMLFLYAANGVTTVRTMAGWPLHMELRDQAAAGKLEFTPRIYASSPPLSGGSVKNTAQARGKVKQQQKSGYDFLKINPGLDLKLYDTIDETADEVGIGFAGHVPWEVGVPHVLKAGQLTIDHLDGYAQLLVPEGQRLNMPAPEEFGLNLALMFDESLIPGVAAMTAASTTWNVPAQSLFEHTLGPLSPDEMAAWPEMQYVDSKTVREWREQKAKTMSGEENRARAMRMLQARRQLIKALHDAGAGLLLGSDSPAPFNVPGFSIHRELQSLVACGLTPYQALQTGTVNVATFFGAEDRYGTISPGKDADLVLLGANPLQDIGATADIRGVSIRGEWLDKAYIDVRYYHLAAQYN